MGNDDPTIGAMAWMITMMILMLKIMIGSLVYNTTDDDHVHG